MCFLCQFIKTKRETAGTAASTTYFKDMTVSEIKVSTVRFWQNELLSGHSSTGKSYSDTYLKSIHVQLSAILNYGMRYYNLPSNPAALCGSIGQKKSCPMNFCVIS